MLRGPQPVSCIEERPDLVVVTSRKLVHGPQRDRRFPELLDACGDVDLARTMEQVPAQVAAGVTDFRTYLSLPGDRTAATDRLAELVQAFDAVATV